MSKISKKVMMFLGFILVIILVISFSNSNSGESLLTQECPDELIVDNMPYAGPPEENISSYYIKDGSRRELAEFDGEWVSQNCSVPETVVY
ncbi:MAG: hypothetical protein ACI88L_000583 [Candidatus Paceibacteria bacterium]|jgi:hypothetical protein